jgi:hypothetical protein
MTKRAKIWLVKYFPFMANINFLVVLVLQFFDIDIKGVTAYILGCSIVPCVILWFESIELKFCTWHRVLLANMILLPTLHIINRLGVKFDWLIYVTILLTVLMLVFATIMMFKDGCTKTDSKRFKKG